MQVRKAFSRIYVEEEALDQEETKKILSRFPNASVMVCGDYHEIFNRRRQSFARQHLAPALILAVNHGELIHQGSPVCQSFDHRYFYYASSVMNCPFDCTYCWLKGMYESGDIVVFVNLQDTFDAVEEMLKEHPVYLCASYDTDLLALDPVTGYASAWSRFAKEHENLLIELRTKGCGRLPEDLAVSDRCILAFTLSPERACEAFEHKAPGLSTRVDLLCEAMEKGFPVRLCFDPILVYPTWKEDYKGMFEMLDQRIDWERIQDISIGTFRLSANYMQRMRRQDPSSALLAYPYVCTDGFYHLPDAIEKEVEDTVTALAQERVPKEKIFGWRDING